MHLCINQTFYLHYRSQISRVLIDQKLKLWVHVPKVLKVLAQFYLLSITIWINHVLLLRISFGGRKFLKSLILSCGWLDNQWRSIMHWCITGYRMTGMSCLEYQQMVLVNTNINSMPFFESVSFWRLWYTCSFLLLFVTALLSQSTFTTW